jgi:hypothetical protein
MQYDRGKIEDKDRTNLNTYVSLGNHKVVVFKRRLLVRGGV